MRSTIIDLSTGVNYSATGRVGLTVYDNQLDLSESGLLRLNDKQSVEFSNQYRFKLQDAKTILLSHLRRGERNPVYLLPLEKYDNHHWRCQYPHYCGDDVYEAKMCLRGMYASSSDYAIQLHWLIKGKHKNLKIRVSYWHDTELT